MTIRTTLAALTAAAAIAVTGCAAPQGDGSAVATTVSPTTSQALTEAPSRANEAAVSDATSTPVEAASGWSSDDIAEAAYLDTVSEYTYPSTDDALMVGWATCALLATGSTVEDLGMEVLTAQGTIVPGFSNDELPYFYGAAIGALCPEYRYQLAGY